VSRRRPLLGLALAWMLGVTLGRAVDSARLMIWGAAVGILILAIVLFLIRHRQWPAAIVALVGLLGMLAYQETRLPADRLHARLDELDGVQGVVANFPTRTDDRTQFVIDSERLPGGVRISYWHPDADPVEIDYGDRLTIDADVEVPPRFAGFDYRRYLATRNVWGAASIWSASQLDHRHPDGGHPLLRWGYQTRQHLFAVINDLPSPHDDLLKGLFFGERAYMSDQVEGSFRDAGVMHVLAVSGLHLAILLGLGWGVLRRVGWSITATYLILLPLAIGYLAIVGFKLSLVRASLMLAFVALGWVIAERGWILRRWIDSLQGLSAAALIILIAHPSTLFNVSFQLSFSATAGILVALQLILPRLNSYRQLLRRRWSIEAGRLKHAAFAAGERVVMLGLITGAAQIAIAPVIAWHFHRLYLGAFIANLAIVPLVTVALWIGVAFLAVAAVGLGVVASVVGVALALALTLLVDTARAFAALPWAYVALERTALLAAMGLLPLLLDWSLWATKNRMSIPWRLSLPLSAPSLMDRSSTR